MLVCRFLPLAQVPPRLRQTWLNRLSESTQFRDAFPEPCEIRRLPVNGSSRGAMMATLDQFGFRANQSGREWGDAAALRDPAQRIGCRRDSAVGRASLRETCPQPRLWIACGRSRWECSFRCGRSRDHVIPHTEGGQPVMSSDDAARRVSAGAIGEMGSEPVSETLP